LIKLRQGNWISRRYKNSRHRYLFDNKWFFPTRRISRVLWQQYDSCWAIFVTFQRQYLHVSRTLFIIKSRVIHYDHKSTHILASVIFRSGEYPREQSASAARNRPRMDPASDASYCGLGLFVEGEERIVAKREPKQTPGRDSPASGTKIILFPRRSRPLAHSHEMRCTVHRYIGHRPSRRLNRGWQMGGLIETSSQHRGRHMAALAGNQNSDMKRITWRLDLSWREDRASLSLSLSLSFCPFLTRFARNPRCSLKRPRGCRESEETDCVILLNPSWTASYGFNLSNCRLRHVARLFRFISWLHKENAFRLFEILFPLIRFH